ncbi:MAG: ATP-binding protein [Cyanobium sp.]
MPAVQHGIAIAHRDYSVQGRCIEVWLFNDRMEVSSPGGLLPELSHRRVHCSRTNAIRGSPLPPIGKRPWQVLGHIPGKNAFVG